MIWINNTLCTDMYYEFNASDSLARKEYEPHKVVEVIGKML